MGGQYKKNLRAEKAKVKLKGAKLPKGLNVTKTEFKVRKIVIREQHENVRFVDGQRQVNLKEILSRLKHHKSTIRSEGLRNVREVLLMNYPIQGHLFELIRSISGICMDCEKETRRDCFKTLDILLSTLTTDAVAPFFYVISSYLRCAMTNINTNIKEDSLLMLDILLRCIPSLVVTHSNKIFQNFLEMISRKRTENDRNNRILTVNMGQKQTTIEWRSKVLQCLQQMLQMLVTYNDKKSGKNNDNTKNFKTHKFSTKEPQYYAINRTWNDEAICSINLFDIFNKTIDNNQNNDLSTNTIPDESISIRYYIEQLMPLLLDAWLEVRPKDEQNTTLSSDAFRTLFIILEIINNLWSLIEIHENIVNNDEISQWYRQEYSDSFATIFLPTSFPYRLNDNTSPSNNDKKRAQKLNKHLKVVDKEFCLQLNILTASLMCRFNKKNVRKYSLKFQQLLQYIQNILKIEQFTATVEQMHIEFALRTFLLINANEMLTLNAEEIRSLLRATIDIVLLANRADTKNAISIKIPILLCEIAQNEQLLNAYGNNVFDEFISDLPKLLLKPHINQNTVIIFEKFAKQNNVIYLKSLRDYILPIIKNLPSIEVIGASDAYEGKKHIINQFYWIDKKQLNATECNDVLIAINDYIKDKRISSYFKFVLQ